ncbi:SHOCT domain-containing protein [Streptomyces sp. ODS28]|uniref:SHOCT domain-containing protein n=1 Tax=Streptomyces sp. ODS28 TaxID=3136688 RepID=UPI0031EBDB84
MYWHDNGMNGWGWFGMILSTVLVLVVIIGVVVLLARASGWSRGDDSGTRPAPSPEQLLAERFARGEIDEEEYQRRLTTLRATAPPTSRR